MKVRSLFIAVVALVMPGMILAQSSASPASTSSSDSSTKDLKEAKDVKKELKALQEGTESPSRVPGRAAKTTRRNAEENGRSAAAD